MRNLIPLSLLAAAASLTALGSPTLHTDRLAAAMPSSYGMPATEPAGLPAAQALSEQGNTLRFLARPCRPLPSCAVRGPMI